MGQNQGTPPAPVSGVLVVDKGPGWTSHDVVARVRRITGERRVGHAGTLDPAATGVLVVCVGMATRIAEYLGDLHKSYRATIRFGVETDTWDAEGEVVSSTDPGSVSRTALEPLLGRFVGEIDQMPPMYSALKRNGTPLYQLARQGKSVERTPRRVTIYRLTVLRWASPDLEIEVECSKGTYIRALAHDLGQETGTGAHLAALRRTAVGHLKLDRALTLKELALDDAWRQALVSPAEALRHMDSVVLPDEAVAELSFGRAIALPLDSAPTSLVSAVDRSGDLVAILRPDARSGWWQPAKVFVAQPR